MLTRVLFSRLIQPCKGPMSGVRKKNTTALKVDEKKNSEIGGSGNLIISQQA